MASYFLKSLEDIFIFHPKLIFIARCFLYERGYNNKIINILSHREANKIFASALFLFPLP